MPNTISKLTQYASFVANEYDEVSQTGIKISGLGTYFSSEFSENVGIGTTLTANVYRPYNILESEFAHVTNTPGLGVYMRQNKSNAVEIYNEIDDYSLLPKYSIIPSTTSTVEGSTVYFDVFTSNVSGGTTIYYEVVSPQIIEINPVKNEVSLGQSLIFDVNYYNVGIGTTLYYDFFGSGITTETFTSFPSSGSFQTQTGNTSTITRIVSPTFSTYSNKYVYMNIRSGSSNGTILKTSDAITIIPRNISVNVSASSTSVNSGGTVTFTVSVSGSSSGNLNYLISGEVNASNFSDNILSSNFSYTSGTAQITKTVNASSSVSFTVLIRTSSNGTTLATSQTVTINAVSAISTYSQFLANAVIGNPISILGQSGTIRTFTVVADPNGNKSIRFPVTWPSSFFNFNNQNINYSFTMASADFNILADVDTTFAYLGVHPISGNSESCCDPYSMSFSGISLFNIRGFTSNAYYRASYLVITSNSGNVNFTTDSSVNGGNGLTGANGYFYLS